MFTAVIGKYGLGAHDIDKEGAIPESSSILPQCSAKKSSCQRLKFFEWLFSNQSGGEPAAVVQDGPGWVGFNYSFVSGQGIQKYGPYCFFENDRLADGATAAIATWWSPGMYQLGNGYKTAIEGDSQYPDQGGTGIFNGVESWKTDQFDNQILAKALDWLTLAASNVEKPFFMHFCTAAVHRPHVPPTLFHDGTTPIFGTTGSPHSDMIKSLDLTVGTLVARLDDLSVLQNTIVVFLSDNGGLPAYYKTAKMYIAAGSPVAYPSPNPSLALHSSAMGLRGWKASVYEGGYRVPWIMRWDAGGSAVRAGASLNHLVGIEDLYSTLLDLAGIDSKQIDATGVTAEAQLPSFGMDTISFKAGLLDPSSAPRRDIFVIMKAKCALPTGEANPVPAYGCRFQTWKAIFQATTGALSDVYDLAADPGESNNLLNTPAGNVWRGFGSCGSKGPATRAGYEAVHKCCTALLSLATTTSARSSTSSSTRTSSTTSTYIATEKKTTTLTTDDGEPSEGGASNAAIDPELGLGLPDQALKTDRLPVQVANKAATGAGTSTSLVVSMMIVIGAVFIQ